MNEFNVRVEEKTGKLIIENARITYRNFRGAAGKYNHEGDRNFNLFIDDPDVAAKMIDDGYNVRMRLADRDDPNSEKSYLLKVNVSYKFRDPEIVLHCGNTQNKLGEEEIHMLDDADIISCDIRLNPSKYERDGKIGKSAYLDILHVFIEPDPFAGKYDAQDGEQ